jgi:DNA-binding NarL/FixJ family response regulator
MAAKRPDKFPAAAKILIVDDHPVVREGLSLQLATQPDLVVCGEAEDIPGALQQAAATKPDLVIVDITLKNGSGLDLIRRLRARDEEVKLLVWSMHPENLYAERVIRAGAQGYLHKGQATSKLLEAIRTVLAGKVFISGDMTDLLLKRVIGAKQGDELTPIERLSDRELEAFKLMGEGLTTERIAARMFVSPKTVETYRARIKDKLGLNNVTELVQRATQWVMENQ